MVPEFVHTTLERTFEFYGWALLSVAACLILFATGYVGFAIAAARHHLLSIPWAITLAVGAAVFCAALLSHEIQPIAIERIGFVLFAPGFRLMMARNLTSTGA